MSIKRRQFIKTAGAGLAIASIAPGLLACNSNVGNEKKKLDLFGLQLYTLRDVMPKDPKGVLKQVADMGYTQVESYEDGNLGMFWGMTNLEFKKYMDSLGMVIVSSHTNIRKDFERKAAGAAAIGMKYLIDPWEGPQKSIDDFKRIAATFNEKGAVCKKAGIRFGYHNHAYPFTPVDGQKPMDVMISETDPDLVDFEMDIYWVVTAGEDPIEWLKKYPGRFKLGHIKDRLKGVPISDHEATCVAGRGSIDFPKILTLAKSEGMKYYIIEQEQYHNLTSLEAAKLNADYMKGLRI